MSDSFTLVRLDANVRRFVVTYPYGLSPVTAFGVKTFPLHLKAIDVVYFCGENLW